MKNLLFYICALSLPFQLSAQIDYSFDLVTSLDYTYVNNSFTEFSRDITVDPKYNYRFGMNVNVKMFEKIYIKSGLRFAQLGFKEFKENIRWLSEFSVDGWNPDPTLPRFIHSTIDQRYYEIPLHMRYEFRPAKFSFYIESGLSMHIYSRTRVIAKSNIESTVRFYKDTSQGSKRFLFCFVSGIGMNYNFSNLSQLFIQPTLRLYAKNDNQFQFENAFRSIGIEFGYRKGFSFDYMD